MAAEWRSHWHDIQLSCKKIVSYTQDLDDQSLGNDSKTLDAVIRNLEIIFEAAQSLPADVHPRLGDEQWRNMAAFKDALATRAAEVDAGWLGHVVRRQIPALLEAMREADRREADDRADPSARGREAGHPGEIPPPGWRDIFWRVYDRLFANNLFIVAAGVAFYALLAIFPALAAVVSIYGLASNPANVSEQLEVLVGVLPGDAWAVLKEQLTKVAQGSSTTLSASLIVSLILTLWTARAGMGALFTALNIVYNEPERRSLIRFYLLALLLTLAAILFCVIALGVIVALPAVLEALGFRQSTQTWANLLRWPLLAASVMFGLAVVYRLGPCRTAARWEWVSWGAVAATLVWLAGSAAFSFYVSHFGSYDETYGSVGAVVILMLWFWLSALIVLLGAQLNAEMEHQTRRDSTVGRPKPMGERGAYVADTLGRRP